MSNDFDDATQLGSIGHNPSVPSQPGQQQPAFHTPNLPEQPQADEDPEGTLLSAHGTTQPALPQQSAPATPNQPQFRQPMPQNLRQPAANPAVAMPAQQPVQPTQPVQPSQPVQPAFHTPNLPEQPQADEDPEGTLLSAHGTTQPALPQQSAPATPNQPQFRQPMPQNLRQPAANPAVAMPAQQPVQPTQPVQPSQPVQPVKQSQPVVDTSMMTAPSKDITEFHEKFAKLVDNVSQVVVGKEAPIRQCATAMVVGGHILLEDNPGTGKTQLARGLANSIDMSFKRIQFTPDLLPSDVVGVTYYDQKRGEFEYREGPIFASIVLADEINRASPKTQSALLEVMEEQKVTVDGVTHPVPQPFMVIATQNPIEQLGTYKLPEAQMDRFLIKTTIGYPSHDVSVNILKQVNVTDRAATVHPVLTGEDVLRMRNISETVHLDDAILEYIVRLVEATRHNERIQVGSSMRGALALTRCARVWAASDNRGYVVPDDVKNLAVPVLAHRITLTAEATFAGNTPEQMIGQILEDVPAPTLGANA